ncbi:hypothetical protein FXO38_12375 [Capsicum annuum]|nr:hypothetical protein FXO37_17333 [Capsicum annuum]KAF3659943.1 hypothetical protein FXO38_12375 [Capsicum annuum]
MNRNIITLKILKWVHVETEKFRPDLSVVGQNQLMKGQKMEPRQFLIVISVGGQRQEKGRRRRRWSAGKGEKGRSVGFTTVTLISAIFDRLVTGSGRWAWETLVVGFPRCCGQGRQRWWMVKVASPTDMVLREEFFSGDGWKF